MMDDNDKAQALFGETMRSTEEGAKGITSPKPTVSVANKDYVSPFESHAETRDKASAQAQDIDNAKSAADAFLEQSTAREAVNAAVAELGMEANEVTQEFADLVHQHKISPDLMKELVEISAKQFEAHEAAIDDMTDEWAEQSEAEFHPSDIAAANSVLQEYGDDELNHLLVTTGAGNNPAVIRFFRNIARELGSR